MRRTKLVSIDGVEFTISGLTLEEVDAIISSKAEMEDAAREQGNKKSREIMFKTVICPSLNGALPEGTQESELWTPQKVYASIDLVTMQTLQREILSFSGLTAEAEKPGLVKSGEVAAA